MDNLSDILARKDYDEPSESIIIKRYVHEHFDIDVSVKVTKEVIMVYVRSASLMNTLRLQTVQIQRACQTEKRIVFRII